MMNQHTSWWNAKLPQKTWIISNKIFICDKKVKNEFLFCEYGLANLWTKIKPLSTCVIYTVFLDSCSFFLMVVYSSFNCEVLLRLSLVFCLGMVLLLIFWTSAVTNEIFPMHGRHMSGRVQCSQRATTVMWTTMSSGNPIYHERHLSCRVQCSHRTNYDDINHEIRQPHLWATVWVQITLPSVEELKPPFWQQWFQITRNCKH